MFMDDGSLSMFVLSVCKYMGMMDIHISSALLLEQIY